MATDADQLTKIAAKYVAEHFLGRGPVRPMKPRMFELQSLPADGLVLNTVAGPVPFETEVNDPEDPPERTFFVDADPEANWDHECSYLVVHRSGRITRVNESSPPSSRTNSILKEIDYIALI